MSDTIKTAGDLREFLAQAMVDVRNGELDPEKANRITKLAGQLNESFFAEIKVAIVKKALGQPNPAIGSLPINVVAA